MQFTGNLSPNIIKLYQHASLPTFSQVPQLELRPSHLLTELLQVFHHQSSFALELVDLVYESRYL